jgi:CheY-like chemotaxis protein
VIDDSDVAREAMARALRSAGFEVFELPSAIGATAVVRRHAIDVVVIDVNMPQVRGESLARLLRSNPLFAKLGVVLVSGEPSEKIEELAASVQADAFVRKDESAGQLVDTVRRLRAGPTPA